MPSYILTQVFNSDLLYICTKPGVPPPNFELWGRLVKKIVGANVPIYPPPQSSHQVSALEVAVKRRERICFVMLYGVYMQLDPWSFHHLR